MATFRTSAAGGSTSGTGNRTAAITPAVGDLLVVYCLVSTNTNDTPTCSDNNGGAYDRIDVCNVVIASVNHRLSVFVRTALMVNTTSTTVTVATGSNTSGAVHIEAISGMSRTGAAAVRSKGLQNNQAAGTAAPALDQNALTDNLTIVAHGSADTTTTPPTNWTERQDTNFATPTIALETATRDSGFTGTTTTFGAASSTTFCAHALELDGSPLEISVGETGAGTETATVSVALDATETGAGSDSAAASGLPTSTETAPGSDAATVSAAATADETGAGTDSAAVSAEISATESGAGADQATLAVEIVLSETGAGTDAVDVLDNGSEDQDLEAGDSGAGTDTAAVSADVTLAETSPGSDALALEATIAATDSGAGADVVSASAETSSAETAPGTDQLALEAAAAAMESGAGQDAAGASAEIVLGEGSPGLDQATAAEEGNPTLSETGPGADQLAIAVEIPLGESAPGSDAVFITVAIAVNEEAPGSDDAGQEDAPTGFTIGETGAGTDASSASADHTVGESAPGRDRCFATWSAPFFGKRRRRRKN